MREERDVLAFSRATLDAANDADLARALIAGNPWAARSLWRRFAPMVLRMLRRTFGPSCDVEDLAQEVFLCVFEKVPMLRDPQALKAFVTSITLLTARFELRRRWTRRWIRLADKSNATREAIFEVDTDSREALMRFYGVLDRINAQDRTLFVLRYIEELTLSEVVEAFGLSLATTKRHLARARAKVSLLVGRDPVLSEYVQGRPLPFAVKSMDGAERAPCAERGVARGAAAAAADSCA
jgi:RNA polymerase sigma-70 factor (ECF subfamily)